VKKHSILTEGIVVLLFLFGAAHATTWYVHPDSTLNSIQAGIDLCSTGDTVLVGAGTYFENINFNGMAITVTSEYGPDTTTIDGSSPAHPDSGSVVLFKSGENNSSVLDGFTLTRGIGTNMPWGHSGGGIECCNASSPTIINNIITADTVTGYGGGIECDYNCNPIISNNTITMNQAGESGGGIEFYDASPTITNNVIDGNEATYGGGIVIGDYCSGDISHNTITNNTATPTGGGGGIFLCQNTTTLIQHNLIANNFNDGVCSGWPGNPTIYCNDIIDNEGYAIRNTASSVTIDADSNWWGDATGPYHPDSNPGGLGDTVSDYVDFIPWLTSPGVEEQPIIKPVEKHENLTASIFRGSLHLPEGKNCIVFDITGRVVEPSKIRPGIYFIEVDGVVTQKVVKVR